jgi:hypothetical protein
MPTASEFTQIFADETGRPLPTVRMTVRKLTDDELFPKATGRRVPQITHEHAAMLLIAVMASPAVKDSSRTVMSFGALVHDGRGKATALEAVTSLLHRLPKDPTAFDWSLEICMKPPQIVLKNRTIHAGHPSASERTDYGDIYIPAGDHWAHWPPGSVKLMKEIKTLSGITLDAIARALVADE